MHSSNAIFSVAAEFTRRPAVVLFLLLAGCIPLSHAADERTYSGCCDASAAAPVNEVLFAAASDEDNTLRLYRRDRGGDPVATVSLSQFLRTGPGGEADIEAGARVGNRIFWIGSHSRNDEGEARPGRRVLLAVEIQGEGDQATLRPVGRPFRGLIDAMAGDPNLARFRFNEAAARPGEAPGALNIEGLTAGPDGSLLIGFRNPVPEQRALLVPLLNPNEVIEGEAAKFGPPIQLDLAGRGIRDIAQAEGRYLILAGPAEGGGRHLLFTWNGGSDQPREIGREPKGFQAEAIVLESWADGAFILSDDGSEKIDGERCEKIKDKTRRKFRASRVEF